MAGRRTSAFFFHGAFSPAEQANFNIQNVVLADGSVLEALGHGIAVWWRSARRDDLDELRDRTRDWIETIAAGYYFEAAVPLDVGLGGWVEVLDVEAREAVIGFIDSRFRYVKASSSRAKQNKEMRRAIALAEKLIAKTHLSRAAKEAWRAGVDPTDEAFLSAFRALECVRRLYGEGESSEEVKLAWKAMRADLNPASEPFNALRDAAKAIRHGDRPRTRAAAHPVNRARKRRDELIDYAVETTRLAIAARI